MFYFGAILFSSLFIYSFTKDRRKIINAIYFLLALAFIYFSLVTWAYEHWPALHSILLLFFLLIPFFMLATGVFLMYNGIVILKKESFSLSNSLSLLMGLTVVLYVIFSLIYFNRPNPSETRLTIVLMSTVTYFFILFIFLFLAFTLYSLMYLWLPTKKDYDYIIIHGSGLMNGDQVTPLLMSRIDKAVLAYQQADKENVKLIASGGQGHDESISEALAIKRALLDKGINEEDILLEDQSTTTYKNLLNSKNLTPEGSKYLFVTNNYHVLRTSIMARKLKMKGEGLGSHTAGYYLPSAFIREFVAILKQMKWFILISVVFIFFMMWVSFT